MLTFSPVCRDSMNYKVWSLYYLICSSAIPRSLGTPSSSDHTHCDLRYLRSKTCLLERQRKTPKASSSSDSSYGEYLTSDFAVAAATSGHREQGGQTSTQPAGSNSRMRNSTKQSSENASNTESATTRVTFRPVDRQCHSTSQP